MKVVYTDVLVIGGGLAGLRMTIAVKRRGHDAVILSLVQTQISFIRRKMLVEGMK